jgi:ABC-type transporter Mla MlaB component
MGNDNNKQHIAAVLSVEQNSVRCAGNWTVSEIHSLEQQLPSVQWPEQAMLTLDMQAVQRMDTSGAWLLARTVRDLEAQGKQVSLHGLSSGAIVVGFGSRGWQCVASSEAHQANAVSVCPGPE